MRILKLLILLFLFPGIAHAQWSMVVIPDTQNYMSSWPNNWPWFESQTDWIRDQDVEFMLGTGDITYNNSTWQWAAIQPQLDSMNTPYILPTGNHDYSPIGHHTRHEWKPNTPYNDYFNETFPGLTPWQEGDWVNSYVRYAAPDGRRLLLLNLEDYPRPEALDWATTILDQYPYDTGIVATHMNIEEGAADPVTGEATYARDEFSEPLWQWLRTTSNVDMVFNGHEYDGDDTDIDESLFFAANWASVADDGHIIHEIGFNTQRVFGGGGSWLRYYTFDGESVHAQTYSPHLDEWKTDHRNDFLIHLPPIVDFSLEEWNSNYGNGLDGFDFLNWQRQLPTSLLAVPEPLTVPEPSALMLLLLGFSGWVCPLRK
ncbi:MAG: metallophosphoesterase [Pirellulales bacterium]